MQIDECLRLARRAHDRYADRGESENRNKELKEALAGGSASDHRYFANLSPLSARSGVQLAGSYVRPS